MFHDVPNRKGGRGELERNTQINEKAAHPLQRNGWAAFTLFPFIQSRKPEILWTVRLSGFSDLSIPQIVPQIWGIFCVFYFVFMLKSYNKSSNISSIFSSNCFSICISISFYYCSFCCLSLNLFLIARICLV